MTSVGKPPGYVQFSAGVEEFSDVPDHSGMSRRSRDGEPHMFDAARADPFRPDFKSGEGKAALSDRYNRIYIAFVLSGIGYMLPFTCFIVAVDYYQNRFPGTTIIFDMTATTIIIGSLGVILNNAIVESLSLLWRVTFGYIISLAVLVFLAIFDVTLEMFPGAEGYWVTMIAVSVIAVGCAVQQSSFYGYANMLPRKYTQAVMVGESFAGVLVSLNRILTKILLDNERINTIIFFVVSIIVIVICCVAFLFARRTQFVRFHLMTCKADRLDYERRSRVSRRTSREGSSQFGNFEFYVTPGGYQSSTFRATDTDTQVSEPPRDPDAPRFSESSREDTEGILDSACRGGNSVRMSRRGDKRLDSQAGLVPTSKVSRFKARLSARWEVTKQIYPFMASFALTFYVTVSLYPGIITEILSCRLQSWMPVILMACFNATDAAGKMLTSTKTQYSKLRLLLSSLARVCLVPLAIMCCRPRLKPTLSGEAWPILITILLGISNGYFGSLPLILAPSQVAPRLRELCGNTMMIAFNAAIICGAFTSYGLDILIGPHPDFRFCKRSNYTMEPVQYNSTNSSYSSFP
ncbi:equilibrative nucleoside transporter 4 [Aplysia californica]|uniref:Equilibrative nucleoside transporter 4 n=1 Tax=Aplysia californica TaxID=6500 RepID=A0ABM0ZVX8_APLCA|nr:equilibrative nucleoside transporter 4 [Aplysia californica]